MNLLQAFMELDKLQEAASKSTWTFTGKATFWDPIEKDRVTKVIKTPIETSATSEAKALSNIQFSIRNKFSLATDAKVVLSDYDLRNLTDELDAAKQIQDKPTCETCGATLTDGGFCPNCDDGQDDLINESQRTRSVYSCTECGFETEMYDDEFDYCCPNCHDHYGAFNKCEECLDESTELSTEHSVVSVVDRVKEVYEAGLFNKLPVGRDKAFTLEISGPDKERLAGYFRKQPEFNYELNRDQGIVSHEFISDKYDVEIFDSFISMYQIPQNESLNEWKDANGTAIKNNTASTTPTPAPTPPSSAPYVNSNIVTIDYDTRKHKLRALADDGVHGLGNVAFPNNLRNRPGQQYEVETLTWNGKNYRASGRITPIPINSVANTQNINENTKENPKMNLTNVFEELDKIYEEAAKASSDQYVIKVRNDAEGYNYVGEGDTLVRITDSEVLSVFNSEKEAEAAVAKVAKMRPNRKLEIVKLADAQKNNLPEALTEDADDEIFTEDEPIVDGGPEEIADTDTTEEEPKQLVLECAKCGALVIKDESDVAVDEATDLANIEDECTFCEEKEGFKILGTFSPYVAEVEEPAETELVEESLLTEGKIKDSIKKIATRLGADGATIVRSFAELISDLIKNDTLYDAAEYVENKAVLKALESGNEKVLNSCTKEDIEDLKQDIEEYKKTKANKKAGKGEEDLDEFLDADINLSLDGGEGNAVDVL